MSPDVVLAWALGGLVAGAWFLSPNRDPRDNPATELVITTALWLVAGLLFCVAIVAVAR